MELKGNKGEWSELYVLLKLLADGEIYAADENMEKLENLVFPILEILRQEKDRNLTYEIKGNIKLLDGLSNDLICEIDRTKFFEISTYVFEQIKSSKGGSINSNDFPDNEKFIEFLELAKIGNLKAKSADKSDITIKIHDQFTGGEPTLGFSIKSMLGQRSTLFNADPGTNFIFSVEGVSLTPNEVKDINVDAYQFKNKIGGRINKIEELGGSVIFQVVEGKILDLNLRLIDGDLPEILAYMLKVRYLTGKSKLLELIDELEKYNPLNYDLSFNHPFYRYKILKFLYDAALGMTAKTVWDGEIQANGGVIVVKKDGDVLAYHTYHKSKFEDYLLNNTYLEQPATSEDENDPGTPQTKEKYPNKKSIKKFLFGWLYFEDNILRIKANLQVRFIK
jgi:hypothetical protein